jgi:hypothetical protein
MWNTKVLKIRWGLAAGSTPKSRFGKREIRLRVRIIAARWSSKIG